MPTGKVACLGIWHLGSVYAACLADFGYPVIGWDPDRDRIQALNNGRAPLFEPGLDELIRSGLSSGKLQFTASLSEALKGSHFVLLTFDTPVDDHDEVDLSDILTTVDALGDLLDQGTILIVSSQVPVGTCEDIKKTIAGKRPSLDFDVACSPENLRLGQAIENFRHPDRVVIGAEREETIAGVRQLFAPTNAPVIETNLRTAEMCKHALNAFLATSVSFANEIGQICDGVGANALKVAEALRTDSRIGKKALLKPGLGFAGATLARDIKILQHMSTRIGYEAPLVNGVISVNQRQNKNIVSKLERICGSLEGKVVGVLGLTYKPGTSTLRRSAAIEIIADIVGKGAMVNCYDPKAAPSEIQLHHEFEFCDDAYAVAKDADALVFVTAWDEFKEMDFDRIRSMMKNPVVLDTQNMLDAERVRQAGIDYYGTGTGSTSQARAHKH